MVNIIDGTPYDCKSNNLSAPITATALVPKVTEYFIIFFQKAGLSEFHRSEISCNILQLLQNFLYRHFLLVLFCIIILSINLYLKSYKITKVSQK